MSAGAGPPLPRLAEIILGLAAGPELREHVIGDMQEEYCSGVGDAKGRIWRELLRALPGLLLLRLRQVDMRAVGIKILLTIGAYLALMFWGIYVTRPIMIGLRDNFDVAQSVNYLLLYFPVRLTGIAIVAAIIARFTFKAELGFGKNFRRWLLPLLLLLVLPPIAVSLLSQTAYPIGDTVLRMAIDLAALVVGALLGNWLNRRNFSR